MSVRNTVLTMSLAALLVGGSGTCAGQLAGAEQQGGPAYSLEGAWFGLATMQGLPPTPSLDTFTSNAQRQGVEGTFLCTIPAAQMPIPGNPGAYVSFTASGHGNWVLLAKNTYAFTAVRSIVDQTGMPFGWARFWGTITAVSEDQYSGTMNAQFYMLDETPFSPVFTGTLASRRIGIRLENQQ
jgi:hypothetical protein